MSFSVVIPARFAATRLPGKPLLDIAGKPMLQRTYEQALASRADRVVIATDDERIEESGSGVWCDGMHDEEQPRVWYRSHSGGQLPARYERVRPGGQCAGR